MINYYLRPENVIVSINHETKEIINLLNLPTQKTISKINNEDYYNKVMIQVTSTSWTETDKEVFDNLYSELLSNFNIYL